MNTGTVAQSLRPSTRTELARFPGFRDLTSLGCPGYAVNIYGVVINSSTGKLKSLLADSPNEAPKYRLTVRGKVVGLKPELIVAEMFWDTDPPDDTPFKNHILELKRFCTLPPDQKRLIPRYLVGTDGYAVTASGEVWRLDTKTRLTPIYNTSGQLVVKIRGKFRQLKDIIAESFLEKSADDVEAILIDGNKNNVTLANVKWITREEVMPYRQERNAKRNDGKRYISRVAMTPEVARIFRPYVSENIIQTCFANEQEGIDYVQGCSPTANDGSQS